MRTPYSALAESFTADPLVTGRRNARHTGGRDGFDIIPTTSLGISLPRSVPTVNSRVALIHGGVGAWGAGILPAGVPREVPRSRRRPRRRPRSVHPPSLGLGGVGRRLG